MYTLLNFISLYHDSVLQKKYPNHQPHSLLNRYIKWLHKKDRFLKTTCHLLTFVQYSEVIVEMIGRKRLDAGSRRKLIMWIEMLKFIFRIIILKKSGNRTVSGSVVSERDLDLMNKDEMAQDYGYSFDELDGQKIDLVNTDKERVKNYVINRALNSSIYARKPENLFRPLSGEKLIAEYIFWLRPVVYSYLLTKCETRAWKPWMYSFAMETLHYLCSKEYFTKKIVDLKSLACFHSSLEIPIHKKSVSDSLLETQERRRRIWLMWYYILRHPVYDNYTKPKILGICAILEKIPLISVFSNVLSEYVPLWDDIYFYTSAS